MILLPDCYLSPGRGDIPTFTPPEAGTRLAIPEGCKVELTEMAGYRRRRYTGPETVTHPSINRARRGLTSFMRRKPLTTTPRRRQWRIRAGPGDGGTGPQL